MSAMSETIESLRCMNCSRQFSNFEDLLHHLRRTSDRGHVCSPISQEIRGVSSSLLESPSPPTAAYSFAQEGGPQGGWPASYEAQSYFPTTHQGHLGHTIPASVYQELIRPNLSQGQTPFELTPYPLTNDHTGGWHSVVPELSFPQPTFQLGPQASVNQSRQVAVHGGNRRNVPPTASDSSTLVQTLARCFITEPSTTVTSSPWPNPALPVLDQNDRNIMNPIRRHNVPGPNRTTWDRRAAVCRHCGGRFADLRRHERTCEANPQAAVCRHCGGRFADLDRHERTCEANPNR